MLTEAADYFKKTRGIKSSLQVPIYQCGQMALYEALDQQSYAVDDYAISYSDYAGLRKMLGYEPVNLTDGHYIIHAYSNIKKIRGYQRQPALHHKTALPWTFRPYMILHFHKAGTLVSAVLLFSRTILSTGFLQIQTTLVIETEQETTVEDYDYLTSLYSSDERFSKNSRRANNWNTKGKIRL